jgi:hypothetical protein
MSEPHTYASARDAGTSSGSHVASTTTSTAPGGSSSRRKTPKPAVSLGLEDEVEFGSDEDLMEVVGEIPMPAHEAWYPGRPDPPPKEKPKKKGLGLSTNNTAGVKSRSGLFGKDKEKGKVKGLDDARLMSTDEMAGRLSAVDLHAAPSLPSLVGGGARRARESSEYSGKSSLKTSSSALGAQGSRRQKVLGKLFGGAGAKKGSKEEGPNVQGRMGTESVESFGSISRFSEACGCGNNSASRLADDSIEHAVDLDHGCTCPAQSYTLVARLDRPTEQSVKRAAYAVLCESWTSQWTPDRFYVDVDTQADT